MDLTNLFGGIYKNKTVMVTGDTGFKGTWLVHWLLRMEANVIGFALHPPSEPNHFVLLGDKYSSIRGNINDIKSLQVAFNSHQPEVVFHLAAQSLVRYSYTEPIETFQTNILGTANVLETCRQTSSVKAVVNVTSDKCYENKEWIWGYRENDPMGGYDPYSTSKGCSELISNAYRQSFFNDSNILLASARAGNVIGGGDWSLDRLLPDMVKAASNNKEVTIRNPNATRPWQHVLDPLSGYLTLGQLLLEGRKEFAEGWNFGPKISNNVTVETVIKKAKNCWGRIDYKLAKDEEHYHEANLLMLDCSKAAKLLKWAPVWNFDTTLERTIKWYQKYYESCVLNTDEDLDFYVASAKSKSMVWTV